VPVRRSAVVALALAGLGSSPSAQRLAGERVPRSNGRAAGERGSGAVLGALPLQRQLVERLHEHHQRQYSVVTRSKT
jgi:hypothetical protein